jgi:uncharacterized repeat protein (TIGR03803 family)
MKRIRRIFAFWIAVAVGSSAQTFTNRANFDNVSNGAYPDYGTLIQGTDGNLYGTTSTGGPNNLGTVFRMTPSGTLTTAYVFCSLTGCADGAHPYGGLILGTDGNFYGATESGGGHYGCGVNFGCGTVFELTPAGTLTTLYRFCAAAACADGTNPYNSVIEGIDGNFYGTTPLGGTGSCGGGCGTVFKLTPNGKITTLHSFNARPDGAFPYGTLVQATNGDFYGTTNADAAGGVGTVFRITPSGAFATEFAFNNTDGAYPYTGMIQATNGDLYGNTQAGGIRDVGALFRMTPAGEMTALYSFIGSLGAGPFGVLLQANNGDFYGTTSGGGAHGDGSVFEMTPDGTVTTIHSFDMTDGAFPFDGLAQHTNGTFYGTTYQGGTDDYGSVFSLSLGLGPFVKPVSTSGKVGTHIIILGTDLTDATSVTFDGTAAAFAVPSATELTTSVPTGAGTGKIEVTTPKGTLKSNVEFRVVPQFEGFSPSSGPVGTVVSISGVSLSQTTAVTFGGIKASFSVDSDTQVTATVPTGADSGKIEVFTLGGGAVSASSFTVTG